MLFEKQKNTMFSNFFVMNFKPF